MWLAWISMEFLNRNAAWKGHERSLQPPLTVQGTLLLGCGAWEATLRPCPPLKSTDRCVWSQTWLVVFVSLDWNYKWGESHGGTPKMVGLFQGKPIYKWMMTRGTPISGSPHIVRKKLRKQSKWTLDSRLFRVFLGTFQQHRWNIE